ncbi:hypothetical protein CHY_2171 [Carboxydothermus hydrogenoformans Z-2901]|uniref:Uncharacterized protein n=1 Tax=Carboxydothermus hydrogenoformans (strain ATCC BAA-161 / DSM 6008 / Z-2901) TaxID=246194 RepID=Q3AA49_CARHZ|nr:hypothetical protein CHY_2171 [Carboxydothermus hydrogenoformans Z-2901]
MVIAPILSNFLPVKIPLIPVFGNYALFPSLFLKN